MFPAKLLAVAAVLVIALATAPPVEAQCYQGGCQTGPCITNILYDHHFDYPSCGAWVFTGYSSRVWQAATCSSGFYDYQAVFYSSPSGGGAGVVYQDMAIPSAHSSADFGFNLDIQGSAPSWWDRLTVTLRDPATDQVLETLLTVPGDASSVDCQFVRASVQGNYAGQTIRLHFESVIWSADTRFVIDEVNYWSF